MVFHAFLACHPSSSSFWQAIAFPAPDRPCRSIGVASQALARAKLVGTMRFETALKSECSCLGGGKWRIFAQKKLCWGQNVKRRLTSSFPWESSAAPPPPRPPSPHPTHPFPTPRVQSVSRATGSLHDYGSSIPHLFLSSSLTHSLTHFLVHSCAHIHAHARPPIVNK